MLRAVTICIFCIFLVLNLVGAWCLMAVVTWYEHGVSGGFYRPYFYVGMVLYGVSFLAIWGLVSELLKRAERSQKAQVERLAN